MSALIVGAARPQRVKKRNGTKYVGIGVSARIAGFSTSTMRRAMEAKLVEGWQTPGGHWRVDVASLEKYVKERT